MTRTPWSSLTGEVTPPQWSGPATVHRMPDDELPEPDAASREQRVRRKAKHLSDTLCVVLPPWTLIEPGSAKEALARKVPAGFWWPFPQEQAHLEAGELVSQVHANEDKK